MVQQADIAVIGGGAAGLAAAVAAAQECIKNHIHAKIVVLEANARIGKKLLATGNGRCNLTNLNVDTAHYHGDTERCAALLKEYSPQVIIDFFADLGLLCKVQDEGRVYPYNAQAAAVLDILRYQLESLHVQSVCDFKVNDVKKMNSGFEIFSSSGTFRTKRIIFASGGMAYPQLGSDGSGFQILSALGHSCTKLFPALVQVKTEPRRAKPLKGARSAACAVLLANGKPVKTVNGEVQFTENGLSGICIFELSRLIGELEGKHTIEISLDLMPEYTEPKILGMLLHTAKKLTSLPAGELLSGYLSKLIGREIVREALPRLPKLACNFTEKELRAVAHTVKDFRFKVTGTMPWKDAQITAGGVPLGETDDGMQSSRCPGLYLAGELLNIDGDCGGFNLHWAWSTGIASGRAAAQSLRKE
jgi:predicted Rossmann fold flavoprotein